MGRRRLQRRTMAPRRPIVFAEQYALALLTAVVLVASVVLVGWAVLGGH